MQIDKRIQGENFEIVHLQLVVNKMLDYGKVELTKRWQAAGISLANELGINGKLVQVDAGYEDMNRYYQRTQEFIFHFEVEQ